MDANFASAYRLMTSVRAREAFDLSKEPLKVRERYGMTRFGQSCLLARRLVEAGVRFVTINTFITVFDEISWDIHGSKPFTSIQGMRDLVAPMYDQGYSALIEDLFQRGMLDRTLVCNLAEFGRTPKINPAGGRDHWPQCWTVYFAGGGFSNSVFELEVSGIAGKSYVLQVSTNLTDWFPIFTNLAGGGSDFTDALSGSRPSRFYRASAGFQGLPPPAFTLLSGPTNGA